MNFGPLFIIVIVCLGVGYYANTLMRSLQEQDAHKGAKDEISLWARKKRREDQLKVELAGEELSDAAKLNDEQRLDLLEIGRALFTWLGQDVPRQSFSAPALPKSDQPVPELDLPAPILFSSTPSSNQGTSTSSSESATSAPSLGSRTAAGSPSQTPSSDLKVSMNPIAAVQRVLQSSNKPPAVQSIIAQVDAILQEKIVGTPFEKQGIRLLEKPDHTMLIEVGLNKYDGIDAVPSQDVRDLIQSCVAEWTMLSSKGT